MKGWMKFLLIALIIVFCYIAIAAAIAAGTGATVAGGPVLYSGVATMGAASAAVAPGIAGVVGFLSSVGITLTLGQLALGALALAFLTYTVYDLFVQKGKTLKQISTPVVNALKKGAHALRDKVSRPLRKHLGNVFAGLVIGGVCVLGGFLILQRIGSHTADIGGRETPSDEKSQRAGVPEAVTAVGDDDHWIYSTEYRRM